MSAQVECAVEEGLLERRRFDGIKQGKVYKWDKPTGQWRITTGYEEDFQGWPAATTQQIQAQEVDVVSLVC